ncbi:MAG: hypothetical protein ACRDMJ_11495 [Solirubrobacteraceae bacterium]
MAVLGGFTVVASQAFSASTFRWMMLGAGILAVTATVPFVLRSARGRVQQALDGVTGAIGVWTIVASVVFSHGTITWLGFASAAAFVAVALTGLTLNQLRPKKSVRSLSVNGTPERELANAR